MNTSRVRARLVAIRAEVDTLLTTLEEEAVDTGEASPWMTMSEYAAYAGYSYNTVRQLLAEGMPHAGRGKLTRIHRDQADQWAATSMPSRRRKQ